MAISRNLIVLRTGMVWLLRRSAPIVLTEGMAGTGYRSAMGHSRKCR